MRIIEKNVFSSRPKEIFVDLSASTFQKYTSWPNENSLISRLNVAPLEIGLQNYNPGTFMSNWVYFHNSLEPIAAE